MAKIPATVVTGFLGSGKTTLIRNLLAAADGRRIALMINEFGDIGIDGEILKGCGDATCAEDDIVELSNGCICCTVADDFIPAMETLIERESPPDHIVIETSGLALPQPLIQAFNWPGIRTRITVDGVVTVVDGPALAAGQFSADDAALAAQREEDDGLAHDQNGHDGESPLADLFADQLTCADMVVLSKTDLLDEQAATRIEDNLRVQTRPGVRCLHSTDVGLGASALLGLGVSAEMDVENRGHHHSHDHDDHDHDDFESFHIELGEIANPKDFLTRLGEITAEHGILRIKGFAAVAGKPMRQVIQGVGPRIDSYFDRPFGTDMRETRIVVIGFHGLDRAAIKAAFEAAIGA